MKSRRLTHMAVGAAVGLPAGVILASNFVRANGVDRGHEPCISELFEENVQVAAGTLVILTAGPIVGAILANAYAGVRI